MIPNDKKNYYDLTLCVMSRENPDELEVYYPVISADSVLLKPGGRQTILHHIEGNTKLKHLTDEEKQLLRDNPKEGGLIRLDNNGYIPIDYINPTMMALYHEFPTSRDMVNDNTFTSNDYGRLVCVRDSLGDPRVGHGEGNNPEWVIYRITDISKLRDINGYTVVLSKHKMDKYAYWNKLDHHINSSPESIDKMVSHSHSHRFSTETIYENSNGQLVYKGVPITFRDDVRAIIVTESVDEINRMNKGDIGLLITKVRELIRINENVPHEIPFVQLIGNQDELYRNTTTMTKGPKLDMSEVTSCMGFFRNCPDLETYMWYDTSKSVDMSYMNYGCTRLTHIPALSFKSCVNMDSFAELSGIVRFFDVSSETVETAVHAFKECTKMECIDLIDLPNATMLNGFFYGDKKLKIVPRTINIPNARTIDEFFKGCNSLETVYEMRTGNVLSMLATFMNCNKLKFIGSIDMSRCGDTECMFYGCSSLETVNIVPNTLSTDISFANTKLTSGSLKNIIKAIKAGSHCELDISNTPAAANLSSADESKIVAKGWRLKY